MLTSTKCHLPIPNRRFPTPLPILCHQSRSGFDDDDDEEEEEEEDDDDDNPCLSSPLFVISNDQYEDE